MSDNVTELHSAKPAPGKKSRLLWLGAAGLILLVAVLILFREPLNLDAVGRFIRYSAASTSEEFGKISFDAHSSNCYAAWDSGLAVASVTGLRTIDEFGKSSFEEGIGMRAPALRRGKKALLLFDHGGSHVCVLKKGSGEAVSLDVDGSIFDADISTADTVCIAASEGGRKTVLHVYDDRLVEIYRWLSASRFLPLCAVSPDGRSMAAVAYGQKDGAFCCFLEIFRTNRKEPECETELGDGLIYDIRFLGNDRICLVGEDAIRVLQLNGAQIGSFDLEAWYLSDYDLGGDGFVLAALNMYKAGNRCTVTTVDADGKQLASSFIDDEILDISAAGSYAAILTTREMIVCRKDLSIYARTPNVWMASNVRMRPDGSAIAISGNSAHLYLP